MSTGGATPRDWKRAERDCFAFDVAKFVQHSDDDDNENSFDYGRAELLEPPPLQGSDAESHFEGGKDFDTMVSLTLAESRLHGTAILLPHRPFSSIPHPIVQEMEATYELCRVKDRKDSRREALRDQAHEDRAQEERAQEERFGLATFCVWLHLRVADLESRITKKAA